MDKNKGSLSTASVWIFIFAALVIAGSRYYHYFISQDFVVEVFADCAPATQSCFVSEADLVDPSSQPRDYKKVRGMANALPHCLIEHSCEAEFYCEADQSSKCEIEYCTPESLSDGEVCNGPLAQI
jgi:hypothetical protein